MFIVVFVVFIIFNSGVDFIGMDGVLDSNMKILLNLFYLLDLCYSRVKKYVEKRYVIVYEV